MPALSRSANPWARSSSYIDCTATKFSRIGPDLLILATGWRTDYEFLGEEVTQALHMGDDGFYLYRHLLHPDLPNLVFLGCHATTRRW